MIDFLKFSAGSTLAILDTVNDDRAKAMIKVSLLKFVGTAKLEAPRIKRLVGLARDAAQEVFDAFP